MAENTLKGIIHEIFDEVQITPTFKKREFVIEFYPSGPQYPEFPIFQLIGDRANIIEKYNIGDAVEVWFNYRGRPWTDKTGKKSYFNSLQAWRIDYWVHTNDDKKEAAPKYKAPEQGTMFSSNNNDDDDLPF
jgi:hypothetical protein